MSLHSTVDVVVVGAGISGMTAAYALAISGCAVAVVEAETTGTEHSSGRSAAHYVAGYGGAVNAELARRSRRLIDGPDAALFGEAVFTPRPVLWVAAPGTEPIDVPDTEPLGVETARDLFPPLRPGCAAAIDKGGADIDVAVLHDGYRRGASAAGVAVTMRCRVDAVDPDGSRWTVAAGEQRWRCGHVVIAAGAWSDDVAALAGVAPLGLVAKRRTLFLSPVDGATEFERWPFVHSMADDFYLKPEAGGHVLCSPCDATPTAPGRPEVDELDVASAIEAINATTTLALRSVRTAWAGLRTFAPDANEAVGAEPTAPGLWWCAGQGGTGIQTARPDRAATRHADRRPARRRSPRRCRRAEPPPHGG